MKRLICLLLVPLILAVDASRAQSGNVSIAHSEPLRQLSIQRSAPLARADAQLLAPATMHFDALGRRFDLELDANTALLSASARALLPPGLDVYRGRIAGVPGSWVRLVVENGVPGGMIFDGTELLAIETRAAGAGPVIFRLADVSVAPGTMSCAVGSMPGNGASLYENVVAELRTAMQQGPGAVEEIEIGALGDPDFAFGRLTPENDILTRLNNVDGIFSSELGIQITVPAVQIFDDQDNPFTDTTVSGDLVDELAAYRDATPAQEAYGLTHLFTGRNLDGSTVGIAFVGALCRDRFGAGLTQATSGPTIDGLVAAHEIGHNFGADHDGDPDGSCPAEPDDQFIMASQTNGSMTFSDCSKQVMLAEAAAASCVTPLPSTDATVTSFGQIETVLLSNPITLNFSVDNRGSIDAQNVQVDISLPNNVTVNSVATTQTSCTVGAGTASCSIGTLAGNSGETVTLSATTDAPGQASFTAVVSATDDDIPGNNSDTHVVTVEPAVNLIVDQPATSRIVIDASGNVVANIRNSSVLDATDVTLSISVDAGLRADSASWSAGDCTINAAQIDCTATTVTAQSATTLTLGMTALTLGTQGYTLTLGSTEQDSDQSDNMVSGSVNVVSATSSNSNDGGSGGLGWLTLMLLGMAVAARGRSHRSVLPR